MTKLSIFTQILMVVVAVTIMFMYIKPTVSHIRTVQDTTTQYSIETDKVAAVNKLLDVQVNKVDGVAQPDMLALKRFVPDSVDELVVMKDLIAILSAAGVSEPTVAYKGTAALVVGSEATLTKETVGEDALRTYPFTVSALMTYQQMKQFLAGIEVNDYLLQIDTMSVKPSESGELAVEILLSTFARPAVSIVATDTPPVVDTLIDDLPLN